ncbi:hypothetical protein ERO13_A05G133633v2, partial [Gossypium hirsutum]
HVQEQEMEIEPLGAILMYELKVQLALIFSHTEKYPDEPPLLNVKSLVCPFSAIIRGIQSSDLKVLKLKLEQESQYHVFPQPILIGPCCADSHFISCLHASENLGMAMIYTLVSSAKEWLSERYGQDACPDNAEEEEAAKDEVIVPHGEPVTVDTFSAWRERFEAELALERAKLIPESALTAPKEKKLIGRQWFENGRASAKGASPVREGYDEEDEEDIDLDNNDFEVLWAIQGVVIHAASGSSEYYEPDPFTCNRHPDVTNATQSPVPPPQFPFFPLTNGSPPFAMLSTYSAEPSEIQSCESQLQSVEACFQDLVNVFLTNELNVGPACCKTITAIKQGCLDSLFPPFVVDLFGLYIKELCSAAPSLALFS